MDSKLDFWSQIDALYPSLGTAYLFRSVDGAEELVAVGVAHDSARGFKTAIKFLLSAMLNLQTKESADFVVFRFGFDLLAAGLLILSPNGGASIMRHRVALGLQSLRSTGLCRHVFGLPHRIDQGLHKSQKKNEPRNDTNTKLKRVRKSQGLKPTIIPNGNRQPQQDQKENIH